MSRVTYQEAETYISELPKFTKKNTLEHTQKFLSFLGTYIGTTSNFPL